MHFELMQCGYILQKMLVREFVMSGSDVLQNVWHYLTL